MKAVQPTIASNGVPYLQMKSVRSHSTSGREKEGKEERGKGKDIFCVCMEPWVATKISLC